MLGGRTEHADRLQVKCRQANLSAFTDSRKLLMLIDYLGCEQSHNELLLRQAKGKNTLYAVTVIASMIKKH